MYWLLNILSLYEQRETEILLHCLLIYYSEHDWPLNQAVSECDQTLSEYFYFCHGYSANEKSYYGHWCLENTFKNIGIDGSIVQQITSHLLLPFGEKYIFVPNRLWAWPCGLLWITEWERTLCKQSIKVHSRDLATVCVLAISYETNNLLVIAATSAWDSDPYTEFNKNLGKLSWLNSLKQPRSAKVQQ